MRRIFTKCMIAVMLFIFSMSGHAQLDVTNLVLKNAGFDENIQFKASDAYILTTSTNNLGDYFFLQDVFGWDKVNPTAINACGATFEFSSQTTLNNQVPPSTNFNDLPVGGCLGLSAGWTAQIGYSQNVLLPAGSYTLEYVSFNNNSAASAGTSLAGWIGDDGSSAMSSKDSFTYGEWETDQISFTTAAYGSGKIQVGLGATNAGSGTFAKIFIDWVKLTCNAVDKTVLQPIVDEANTLYGDGSGTKASELKAALDAYQPVAGNADNSPALITAVINLCIAVKDYKDAETNETFFVNAIAEINDLLDEADALLANYDANKYPKAAEMALDAAYTNVDKVYDSLTAANIQGYIDNLRTAIESYKASILGMKIQYKFDNVSGNVVTNTASGATDYNGTMYNDASVIPMGKYNVLSLGNGTGYLDMGQSAGYLFPTIENYTVSIYYRVDKAASLSGDGYFLWSFATSNACGQTVGAYSAYRLNSQIYMLTSNGYSSEAGISLGSAAAKDGWHNLVYRQTGNFGELYIDGDQVGANDTLRVPSAVFSTPPAYNWIGRSPFTSDNYLKNTLVYDFEFYNQSVPDMQIDNWAAVVPDLDNAYNYGTAGDFSQLSALIANYNNFLTTIQTGDGVGQYPEAAVLDFQDAIGVAQALVTENKASQFLIDDQVTTLTAAYNTFLGTAGSMVVYPASEGDAPYHFESGLYYIQVGDYYLTVPENGVGDTYLQLQPYINNDEKVHNNQVWNIQYNPLYSDIALDPPQALFSFVSDTTVWDTDGDWHMDELGRMKKGDTPTAQSDDVNNWSWREHRIYFNGTAYSIANHENETATVTSYLAFDEVANATAKKSTDKKFNFIFRTIDDVVANPAIPNAIQAPKVAPANKANIYGSRGEIVVSGVVEGDRINVYDISGRMMKTLKASDVENRINMVSGIYIVRVVTGQTSTVTKVIVR